MNFRATGSKSAGNGGKSTLLRLTLATVIGGGLLAVAVATGTLEYEDAAAAMSIMGAGLAAGTIWSLLARGGPSGGVPPEDVPPEEVLREMAKRNEAALRAAMAAQEMAAGMQEVARAYTDIAATLRRIEKKLASDEWDGPMS